MHLNLTPKTIKYHNGRAKIGDFWFSQQHKVSIYDSIKSVYLTRYSSLELGKEKRFSFKSDIWSIGLIFYVLLHNELPFDSSNLQNYFDIL